MASDGDPRAAVSALLSGARRAQIVSVVASLGLADLLSAGPQDIPALASAAGAHPVSMHRLMRAAAALGIFTETAPSRDDALGTFELTPVGRCLLSNSENSLRYAAIYSGTPEVYRSWGHLEHSIRTGECAFDSLYGMDMFQHFENAPEIADVYNKAMTNLSTGDAKSILGAYDFKGISSLMDVAGGEGRLLMDILEAYPHMNGVLVELPRVADVAREKITLHKASDRCTVLAGSFLTGFTAPEPVDACMLKNIVLNWDDEKASTILRNCAAALNPKGRLLVVEPVLQSKGDDAQVSAKLVDINMMVVCPGGRVRTDEEFSALLASAGFELVRVIPTAAGSSIAEAIKQSAVGETASNLP